MPQKEFPHQRPEDNTDSTALFPTRYRRDDILTTLYHSNAAQASGVGIVVVEGERISGFKRGACGLHQR